MPRGETKMIQSIKNFISSKIKSDSENGIDEHLSSEQVINMENEYGAHK